MFVRSGNILEKGKDRRGMEIVKEELEGNEER
jgi:hypothetical protein